MIRYKLVTQDYKTQKGTPNETIWEIGVTHQAKGSGNELCTDDVIHSYASPELAILINPLHANIQNPRLIKIECSPIIAEDEFKAGHKFATMLSEIPIPLITIIQRVAFAILCAREVCNNKDWVKWANSWLSGVDRTYRAARSAASCARAAYAAHSAAYATHSAASCARAAYATHSAVYAAHLAADSAVYAADLAADEAAYAAYSAADSAAYAADEAVKTKNKIDFIKLSKQALSM